jgi:hypothetical protein
MPGEDELDAAADALRAAIELITGQGASHGFPTDQRPTKSIGSWSNWIKMLHFSG